MGVDSDARRAAALNRGESYIEDMPAERLQALAGLLSAATRYAALADWDAVIVAVPTPLTRNREPDLGPLVGRRHARWPSVLRKGQLMVLESTTYPGTTRERWCPCSRSRAWRRARDFNVAFSPERVDPGRTDYTMRNTPKVVGGLTPDCRSGPSSSTARCATRWWRSPARARRAGEAAGERLPVGEHRAGQRAGDAVRAHGHRRVGGRGRGRHQALRVHALQPGPGDGRPLPARRPVLPGLEGARVRASRPSSSSSPAR